LASLRMLSRAQSLRGDNYGRNDGSGRELAAEPWQGNLDASACDTERAVVGWFGTISELGAFPSTAVATTLRSAADWVWETERRCARRGGSGSRGAVSRLDRARILLDPTVADARLFKGTRSIWVCCNRCCVSPLPGSSRDDGSHHPDDQVQDVSHAVPWLEPNSLYICAGFGVSTILSKDQSEQHEERPRGTGKSIQRRPSRAPSTADGDCVVHRS
jgi:hypothetical protein